MSVFLKLILPNVQYFRSPFKTLKFLKSVKSFKIQIKVFFTSVTEAQ